MLLRHGPARSKAGSRPDLLPVGGCPEQAAGKTAIRGPPNFFSSLFFLCIKRPPYSFLHRLLAKNKQTKAGTEQGPSQAAGN